MDRPGRGTHLRNEDTAQEYACLRLEGRSHAQAVKECHIADVLTPQHKHRGPISGGRRPVVNDMLGWHEGSMGWSNGSYTQDSRTVEEQEEDFEMSERCRRMLVDAPISDVQRQAIEMWYGFTGVTYVNQQAAADELGISMQCFNKRCFHAIRKMRIFAGAA